MLGAVVGALVGGGAVLAWRAARFRRDRAPTSPDAGASGRAELTSKIGHELKNPIMSVKGLASSGMRLYGSMSDDERLEFFGLIDAEANRLRLIADEISMALRIEAGQLVYDVRAQDLGPLVQEVAWRTPVGEHAMVVEVQEGLKAPLDSARLTEVLTHLIDNAAKYSPPQAPIEVRAYRSPDGAEVLDVSDRGPGIPPDRREAVFERFGEWRPPGYEDVPGAGLGLFICRAHLKAMGGRIDIQGERQTGTMMRVMLGRG